MTRSTHRSASRPRVTYLCPASELHGGIRVLLEHAEGLSRRGWDVRVVGPEPAPTWHELTVPYLQQPIFEPGGIGLDDPRREVLVGSYYTTLEPAVASGAGHVFHFCQGWEGVHREFAPRLPDIDRAYRLDVPKLLVSEHLRPILEDRYGCRCHVVGQAIDHDLFRPDPDQPFRASPDPMCVAVVGPFGIRPKGVDEALEGLRRAKAALARDGRGLEVHRVSTAPLSDDERALGMTDVYHHQLGTAEMAAFYRGVDALVFASHDEEGFGLPPLEAMACGTPVAAGDIRPLRVLGDAVLRFPPGDVEALAERVVALAEPATRRRLREIGLEVAARFTFDAVLDRLEAAFAAEGVPGAAPEVD